jgi:glycerophosphoryl diester phosphodiesterase
VKEHVVRPNLQTLTRLRPSTSPVLASRANRQVVNVAHRGASAYAPENTLAAVRKAIARDADLVEFDVHRTRDGALVLLHDATLERTTDVRRVFPRRAPWRVQDFTHAELMRLDAGSWLSGEYAGERIPTLDEAFDVLALSGRGALIELKSPRLQPGIVEEVVTAATRRPSGHPRALRVTVQSFDHQAMLRLRELGSGLGVGLLGTPPPARLPELAGWADQVGSHHHRVSRPYVDRVQSLGMKCFVWTVNRAPSMRRALHLGVDGVITDRPDVMHAVRLARSTGR